MLKIRLTGTLVICLLEANARAQEGRTKRAGPWVGCMMTFNMKALDLQRRLQLIHTSVFMGACRCGLSTGAFWVDDVWRL